MTPRGWSPRITWANVLEFGGSVLMMFGFGALGFDILHYAAPTVMPGAFPAWAVLIWVAVAAVGVSLVLAGERSRRPESAPART